LPLFKKILEVASRRSSDYNFAGQSADDPPYGQLIRAVGKNVKPEMPPGWLSLLGEERKKNFGAKRIDYRMISMAGRAFA